MSVTGDTVRHMSMINRNDRNKCTNRNCERRIYVAGNNRTGRCARCVRLDIHEYAGREEE